MDLRVTTYILGTMVLLCGAILTSSEADAETAIAARLTEQDSKDINRVKDYLEGLSTLKSEFLQVASNGSVASGKLFLSRPGDSRE